MSNTNLSQNQNGENREIDVKVLECDIQSLFDEFSRRSIEGLSEPLCSRFTEIKSKLRELEDDAKKCIRSHNENTVKHQKRTSELNQELEIVRRQYDEQKKNFKTQHTKQINLLQEHCEVTRTFLAKFDVESVVERIDFSTSCRLLPLEEDPRLPGRIRQLHSNVADIEPLQNDTQLEVDAVFIPFYPGLEISMQGTVPKWKINVKEKTFIHLTLCEGRITAEWDESLTAQDIDIANTLLFSVVAFKFRKRLGSNIVETQKFQCCQLFKPGNLTIHPIASPTSHAPKRKTKSRQCIAWVDVAPFGFMLREPVYSWLKKTLLESGEFEMEGYNGDANFLPAGQDLFEQIETQNPKIPEDISKTSEPCLPYVILSVNSNNSRPVDLSRAGCRITLFNGEVELTLFEQK